MKDKIEFISMSSKKPKEKLHSKDRFIDVSAANNNLLNNISTDIILDSISDGIYVTDLNRQIIYWSKSAEQISGWSQHDVLGKRCKDDILCHVDKEQRRLCGRDTCPLYQAIISGQNNIVPVIIFLQTKSGKRLPVQVSVSPVRDKDNNIVGGVEVFRDLSELMKDIMRAKSIQSQILKLNLPKHAKIKLLTYYQPYDIIGGDFYAVNYLSENQYAFILADIMGHGVSAALHTMHMSSLWERNLNIFPDIRRFMENMNNQLYTLIHSSSAFATAVCGIIDLKKRAVTIAGAGHPNPFLFQDDGSCALLDSSGLPLGIQENISYTAHKYNFQPGSKLLMYTDGAIEIKDNYMNILGYHGFLNILKQLKYGQCAVAHDLVINSLLNFSYNANFNDDVTLVEIQWPFE